MLGLIFIVKIIISHLFTSYNQYYKLWDLLAPKSKKKLEFKASSPQIPTQVP